MFSLSRVDLVEELKLLPFVGFGEGRQKLRSVGNSARRDEVTGRGIGITGDGETSERHSFRPGKCEAR
jgi:hypothetical protein